MAEELKEVTCNSCGQVYVQISLVHAIDAVDRFNEYFNTLPKEKQDSFYGGNGASLNDYLHCWCGNDYRNFRDAKPEDCPEGCTISTILSRDECYILK
jgi:hypothetical protein